MGRKHIAYEPSPGLSRCFGLIRQPDSPCPCRFRVRRWSQADRDCRRKALRAERVTRETALSSGPAAAPLSRRSHECETVARSLDRIRSKVARFMNNRRSVEHRDSPRSETLPRGVPTLSRVRQSRGLLVPSKAVALLPRVSPSRSDVTEPILVPKLRI